MTGSASGFDNVAAARLIVRRLKLRRGLLDIQRSIPALLNVLDQPDEAVRSSHASPLLHAANLRSGDSQGRIGAESIDGVEAHDMREQQLLQGVDLIFQLLNSLNQGLAHGCFSSIRSNPHEATSAAPAAHRLSDEPSLT